MLRKTQIHFFFLTARAAQTAQTEEFMFQIVAYRPTVYRTGVLPVNVLYPTYIFYSVWKEHLIFM